MIKRGAGDVTADDSSEFARAFREEVADARRRLGLLKKELARDCRMRPDRFAHLQSGLRRPTPLELANIVEGLHLDDAAAERLLRAAGAPAPRDRAGAPELAGRLGEPAPGRAPRGGRGG